MPTYCFKHKKTGEEFEKFMSISARELFLLENPDIEPLISGTPMIVDPVRIGVRKIDSGFKEVLQKIHTRNPGSQLNKTNNF